MCALSKAPFKFWSFADRYGHSIRTVDLENLLLVVQALLVQCISQFANNTTYFEINAGHIFSM
jgi:hypothetical protein